MYQGAVVQPNLSFDLSGQANGGKPYWAWNYKNLAPRFAVAYLAACRQRILAHNFRRCRKEFCTRRLRPVLRPLRRRRGQYFRPSGFLGSDHNDQQSRRRDSAWTHRHATRACWVRTIFRLRRLLRLRTDSPTLLPTDPDTYGLAIAWGIDDHLKTPYSHVVDFSITRELGAQLRSGSHLHGTLRPPPAAGNRFVPTAGSGRSEEPHRTISGSADAIEGGLCRNSRERDQRQHSVLGKLVSAGRGAAESPVLLRALPRIQPPPRISTISTTRNSGNETLGRGRPGCLLFPGLRPAPARELAVRAQPAACPSSTTSPSSPRSTAGRLAATATTTACRCRCGTAMAAGLQFDFNYVYSKSIDVGSNAERVNGFESNGLAFNSQVINAFSPDLWRAPSDFDTTHQLNANWVWDLPYGRGRHWGGGGNKFVNGVFGGWGFNGLYRWTSGFPFSVEAGDGWSTNFELAGLFVLTGPKPKTGVFLTRSAIPPSSRIQRAFPARAPRAALARSQLGVPPIPAKRDSATTSAAPAILGSIPASPKCGT